MYILSKHLFIIIYFSVVVDNEIVETNELSKNGVSLLKKFYGKIPTDVATERLNMDF